MISRWQSSVFHDGQQLAGAADGHEPREVVVVAGEVLVRRHADEDDGLRVEALGLVDGGVADGVWRVLLFRTFAQVMNAEDTAVAERAAGDSALL